MSLPPEPNEGVFQPYSFLNSRGPRTGDSLGASIDADAAGGSIGAAGGVSAGHAVGGSLQAGDSLRGNPNAGLGSPASAAARRTPAARTPGGTIPHESEHAEFLSDKLEYLVPPPINAVERETPLNSKTVFMGHMRFETTPAEVRWIIRRLCNVTALKVEIRAKGCFLVHLASEQDEAAVRTLHRRILMDHHGMWIARTPQEASILNDYVEQVLCRGPKRRLRLPKDCVTVETPHSGQSTPVQDPNSMQMQRSGSGLGASGSNRSPMHFSSYGGGGGAGAPLPPPPGYGAGYGAAVPQTGNSPHGAYAPHQHQRPPPPSYAASGSSPSVVVGHHHQAYGMPPYSSPPHQSNYDAHYGSNVAPPYTGSPVSSAPPPPPYGGYSGAAY